MNAPGFSARDFDSTARVGYNSNIRSRRGTTKRPRPKESRMNRVTNKDAADVLFNVATILELAEDNPYRVRAYRRAARLLLSNRDDARLKLTAGQELDLPGLGPRLRKKLGELLSTGHMRFYVELCADLPDEVSNLMLI